MNLFKERYKQQSNAFGFKILRRPLTKKEHQIGKSDKKRDKPRKAMPPGKRMSKTGKIYYEYRKNRSDLLGKTI